MGLYPWQYITKPPFQFSGISIRNLAPLISPISTLGSPFGAAAQKVVNAKSAMISLIVEPPGITGSIAGKQPEARIQEPGRWRRGPLLDSHFRLLNSFYLTLPAGRGSVSISTGAPCGTLFCIHTMESAHK